MNFTAKNILFFLFLIQLSHFVEAQSKLKTGKFKKIELLHANSLEFDKHINARRLLGDVAFKHENAIMYCDSAYLYENNNVDAFSNVHIQQGDSLNMYGDFLKYNGNEKKAEIQRNIRLLEKDMTLTTDILYYDLDKSVANYNTGGKIVNKDNVLTSQLGTYYSGQKRLAFKKNVVLTNLNYVINCDTMHYNTISKTAIFLGPTTIKSKENFIYCEKGEYNTATDISNFSDNAYILTKQQKLKGDSLHYDRKAGYGRAINHIEINDTVQHITITGNHSEYFEKTGKSIVTREALMVQMYGKDTLFLHADTLRSEYMKEPGIKGADKTFDTKQDTSQNRPRILYAYNKVKFFKHDMQGRCDSLTYTFTDSIMRLYKDPVLWSDQSQLTGDVIEVKTGKGQLKYLVLTNNSFIISQEDSSKFNQIKGKKIRGTFSNNKLYKIKVEGNGQTVYYGKDKAKYIGVNVAECSDMLIFLKENKVDRITFITKPDAILHPLKELPASDLLLKDFKWRMNLRPQSKKDVFKWEAEEEKGKKKKK